MNVISWTVIGLLLGAMPLAYWLAQVALGVDIRVPAIGDGNPGAGNAWRAGGWRVGLPAALLDYGKGAVPVALAHYSWGLTGWALVPVGLAPVVGHAFSPFLHGRGGKGVAATFGTWTGLTSFFGPLAFGVTCGLFWRIQRADGWTMAFGLLGLLAYLALAASHPGYYVVWAGNAGIMMWKHRQDLRKPIGLRPGLLSRTQGPGD
jgi:glycerol-3-phosphate acyltransferase PlsY